MKKCLVKACLTAFFVLLMGGLTAGVAWLTGDKDTTKAAAWTAIGVLAVKLADDAVKGM